MSVFPDKLYEFGGKPVSSGFEAMWGNNVYFVDYDNGHSASHGGLKPNDAFKYLDTALSVAGAWDVIYCRGRTTADTDGGDPYYCLPSSTSNFTTAENTQYGLSIIGTPIGRDAGSLHGTCQYRGSATVNATPAIKLNSPFINMENIGWRRGGSTVAAVQFTGKAFNSSIYNCLLQKVTTYPALLITDAYYVNVHNCIFQECLLAVTLHAAASNPSHIVISDCVFRGQPADISADIWINATGTGAYNLEVKRCYFNHIIPSGGLNKYFVAGAASTGMISDCYTGAAADTIATNLTLNGVLATRVSTAQVTDMA